MEIKNGKLTVFLNPALRVAKIEKTIIKEFCPFEDDIIIRFVADGSVHHEYLSGF